MSDKIKTHKPKLKKGKKGEKKIEKVMHEFKEGVLHSGSPRVGPKVTNPKQAIAIAISESKKRKHRTPVSRTQVPKKGK